MKSLAQDDTQLWQILSLIEVELNGEYTFDDVLITRTKLIYFIENQKVITDIFTQQLRQTVATALG